MHHRWRHGWPGSSRLLSMYLLVLAGLALLSRPRMLPTATLALQYRTIGAQQTCGSRTNRLTGLFGEACHFFSSPLLEDGGGCGMGGASSSAPDRTSPGAIFLAKSSLLGTLAPAATFLISPVVMLTGVVLPVGVNLSALKLRIM